MKPVMFADIIIHLQNLKESMKKVKCLLELRSEFDKVAGHKVSIYKAISLLYTRN